MLNRILCALVLLVTMAASAPAEADRYHRRPRHRSHTHVAVVMPWGLYVGAGLGAAGVLHQSGGDDLLGDGFGLSLHAGLRVHQLLALELGWLGTLHEPRGAVFAEDQHLVLNGITADARVYLPAIRGGGGPGLEPYLQGGLGVYLLDNTYFGTQSTGTGFQLGGGLDIPLGPHLVLGARGLYRGLAMGPVDATYTDTFVGALTTEVTVTGRF